MPIAPVILPVDAVQAPPTGMVNQFDGRFSQAERGCERSCFYCRHKGQVACKRDDQCAHFCLREAERATSDPEALRKRVANQSTAGTIRSRPEAAPRRIAANRTRQR